MKKRKPHWRKLFTGKNFLGEKSHWTILIGKLCHWTKLHWTSVSMDNYPLDTCYNIQNTIEGNHQILHQYHQTIHLFVGFSLAPAGQLKSFANSF